MAKRKIKNRTQNKGDKTKTPTLSTITAASTNHLHPAFCFRYNTAKQYSIKQFDRDTQASLANTLYELGQLTWNQIIQDNHHGKGCEKIPQNSIKESLPSNTPGDRKFLSLRLGHGKNSVIVGWRENKIFYIVWIDPNGKVYSHG